jgi:hypothetical protein
MPFRSAPARLIPAAALLALSAACSSGSFGGSTVPTSELVAGPAISAPRGMVVSASSIASAVGRDVLAAGGNAVAAGSW